MITLTSSLRADFSHIQITHSTAVMTESLRLEIASSPCSALMHFHGAEVFVTLSIDGDCLSWTEPDESIEKRRIVTAPLGFADLGDLPVDDRMAIVGSHVISGLSVSVAFDDETAANKQMRILFRLFPQVKAEKRIRDQKTGLYFVVFGLIDPSHN